MTNVQEPPANIHCRKRSFDFTLDPESCSNLRAHRPRQYGSGSRSVTYPIVPISASGTAKRRLRNHTYSSSMPVHIASMSTYPSFMSVYGSHQSPIETEQPEVQTKEQDYSLNTQHTSHPSHPLPFSMHHRGSITSMATESTASSPATSHSSPLFTDPSPSSSPESASSNPPLSAFNATMRLSNHDRQQNGQQTILLHPQQTIPQPINQRSESPNSGNKNVKNLSLNMSAAVLPKPTSSAGFDGNSAFSAPVSPRDPQRSGRKKPTNLTIRTPGFQQVTFPRDTPSDVPPTPSSKPSLLHVQSSPSFPTLSTPTTSSSGGLYLSLPSFGSVHSRPGSDSSFTSQSVSGSLPGLREEVEARKSQETQEKGYPAGPIKIYESGVYLYLEPTLEEASNFDTIINVAKEIKNPFENSNTENKTVVSIWREDHSRNHIVEPQTAVSEKSFKSAWEFQPADAPTPITPRPQSSSSRREPEYVHVQWDHNSEILEDLYPLCKVIDDRVHEGKKVLVHCQLGVSRSASLVIAYGLYKGYQPDFHSMYMQVKSRSQWVGPNMSLIYQLTDFRSKVAKGEYQLGGRTAPIHWFKKTPVSSSAVHEPTETSQEEEEDASKTPQASKPLRSLKLDKELPPVPLFPQEQEQRTTSHIIDQLASSITASASVKRTKSKSPQPSQRFKETIEPKAAFEPRTLPFRKLSGYANQMSIPPHRPRNAPPTGLHIRQPSAQMDLARQDVPLTPSLFSPRATEFLASPFGISSAIGELAISGPKSARSVRSIPPPSQESILYSQETVDPPLPSANDPRSPHQQGEPGEILRHIDEVL